MKTILRASIFIISFLTVCLSCNSQPHLQSDPDKILPGAYNIDAYFPSLVNKRFGLVVNQTSMINQTHLVDTLLKANINVKKVFSPDPASTVRDIHKDDTLHMIKKVFAPEHGFRGQADRGEKVKDGMDIKTGLPIVSLYGSNKKPTVEHLEGLDVVIFDVQDVGLRFYTYISTLHYVMEACAENNVQMIVLDRPNPNGMFVDGPILDLEFRSFVGMHPIPILHGLTVGELAKMINGEKWLAGGITCDLTVIPVKNYDHGMTYSLPIKPSPNLPNDLSIALYPSLCMFEGTVISVGRGTYEPFQQIGHPSFSDLGYSFTPVSIDGMSKYPKHQDKICYGIKFDESSSLKGFSLKHLIEFYQKFGNKEDFFNDYFNTLAGTDELRNQIIAGKSEEEIRASWKNDLDKYKAIRKKYLLYADYE